VSKREAEMERYFLAAKNNKILIEDRDKKVVWWLYPGKIIWNEARDLEKYDGEYDWKLPYLRDLSEIDISKWPINIEAIDSLAMFWSREPDLYAHKNGYKDYICWKFAESCDSGRNEDNYHSVMLIASMR
jgi:hypothetical protein